VIAAHLAEVYDIDVAGTTEVEPGGGVHHVRRGDGPDWIARVFPPERPVALVQGEAEILEHLADKRFPAERCATDRPVTMMGNRAVLVTEHTGGVNGRPDHSATTLLHMADLLGRLQTLSGNRGALQRVGGGWHHLSVAGGGRDEDVRILLSQLGTDGLHARLRAELESLDTGAGLPTAFAHPDFTTPNAMIQGDGTPVIIDWTNAGIAPRIQPFGQLLLAGAWDMDLVDVVAGRYHEHISLTEEELTRLPDMIRGFGVVLAGWGLLHMPAFAAQQVASLGADREMAERIAARVREVMARGQVN
jgi:Ser/Thr protein kinase RdoA (MazF antagonist)